MNRRRVLFILWILLPMAHRNSICAEQPWGVIEEKVGVKGAVQPDGAFKITTPRTDFAVKRRGVEVAPPLALTSWMAFKSVGQDTVVTHGDLCLREEEVNAVMDRLQQGGIETSALHNHLMGENPRVMFLHFWGRGDPRKLAATLRAALDQAGGVQPPPKPLERTLNQDELEKVMGKTGKVNAGVVQFGFSRPFPIRMHGEVLPPSMGMATAINFQPTSTGAATAGDFVVREGELSALLETLRRQKIDVTAVHNHMLEDNPRMFFVHFWGEGEPVALARGLRAALDTLSTSSTRESHHLGTRRQKVPQDAR